MSIPVENIYYLLCYAWNEFAPRKFEKLASEEFPDALHLFAWILDLGVRSLHQRGFESGYITLEDSTSSPRGRILMAPTIRLTATQPARVHCSYEEMSQDVLSNQILKATLGRILGAERLDRRLRASIRRAHQLFESVSEIELTPRVFHQVRVHQNNRYYAFLLNVSRFLFDSLQPLEGAGSYRFHDVLREAERMRRIFEKFVHNFYRRHGQGFSVGKERMDWSGEALGESDFSLIPRMETDVTLRSPDRVLVIECKYTESIYQTNYLAGRFRSPHLYQLAAYLRNLGGDAEGILLYPTAGVAVRQSYRLQGYQLHVATLDLHRRWPEIAASLSALIAPKATS